MLWLSAIVFAELRQADKSSQFIMSTNAFTATRKYMEADGLVQCTIITDIMTSVMM